MRFKTLVLIPLVAVLATTVHIVQSAHLPTSQNQASANAPQLENTKALFTQAVHEDNSLGRINLVASRSSVRTAYSSRVVTIGRRYIGTPYCHGGTSPRCFDCSGFTKYVFHKYGVYLPENANRQLHMMKRIPRSKAHAGDLVFFINKNGYAYHVGIYLGNNKILHSPKPGKRVKVERIWSRRVVFARQR